MTQPFVPDPFAPRRRATREVRVGDVGVGGRHPIRIQSMTTTETRDVSATAAQIERLVDAGCEIVRVTVPSIRDAEALRELRAELCRRRVRSPLVADIHFTPNAALIAAEFVEKVRINPGNYADRKRFEVREYTDSQYADELERVAERFRPLVRRCRELGRAMRIGTNHGSLSDRILNRYGDTPRGMVESALEFLDVCEHEGVRDVVFSMKASNPQVAIHAYRLLAARLAERAPGEPGAPFHVGVTEAGGGLEGRIKSAIGIGALLEDGLGDTIRVSLTEDPVAEIPVAWALARRYEARWREAAEPTCPPVDPGAAFVDDPFTYRRRETRPVATGDIGLGGGSPVRVELDLGEAPGEPDRVASELSRRFGEQGELACEGLRVTARTDEAVKRLRALDAALAERGVRVPLVVRLEPELLVGAERVGDRWVIEVGAETPRALLEQVAGDAQRAEVAVEWNVGGMGAKLLAGLDRALAAAAGAGLERMFFSVRSDRPVHAARLLAARLRAQGQADLPIVLAHRALPARGAEEALIDAAVDLGAPLCDGIGDAVALPAGRDAGESLDRVYRILQGARLRTTWTEYISCPSCGRTQFDLEETTARVRERTEHLNGVKIAVMGCIVNGPGEMADADFGYVGSGPGLVNLYVGQEVAERHVPAEVAPERLIELIRKHGRWIDPEASSAANSPHDPIS